MIVIDNYSRTKIYVTDLWREWDLPKFDITMKVNGDILDIYWFIGQEGTDVQHLGIDYNDVGGYGYANPTSAADLMSIIDGYIESAWTDIGPGGDILTAKADLLSNNGTTDEILPGGANEYYLKRDNAEATGLKWVPVTDITSAANIGAAITASASATPNNTDEVATSDSGVLKKITWTNVKVFLKTYFDTLYTTTAAVATQITTALTGYLTSATAAATYQPLDSDLTTIAGLTATTDNFIQSKSSAWASRTIAQVKTDLGIPGVVFSKSSSDQATTSTGLANITNIGISIAANQNIYFKAIIKVGCSGTNGARYAVTLPTGATMLAYHAGTSVATVSLPAPQWLTTSGTEGATINILAITTMVTVIEGWVYNGANAGTIQVQGRSVNAANTVTWYSGSMITGQILN